MAFFFGYLPLFRFMISTLPGTWLPALLHEPMSWKTVSFPVGIGMLGPLLTLAVYALSGPVEAQTFTIGIPVFALQCLGVLFAFPDWRERIRSDAKWRKLWVWSTVTTLCAPALWLIAVLYTFSIVSALKGGVAVVAVIFTIGVMMLPEVVADMFMTVLFPRMDVWLFCVVLAVRMGFYLLVVCSCYRLDFRSAKRAALEVVKDEEAGREEGGEDERKERDLQGLEELEERMPTHPPMRGEDSIKNPKSEKEREEKSEDQEVPPDCPAASEEGQVDQMDDILEGVPCRSGSVSLSVVQAEAQEEINIDGPPEQSPQSNFPPNNGDNDRMSDCLDFISVSLLGATDVPEEGAKSVPVPFEYGGGSGAQSVGPPSVERTRQGDGGEEGNEGEQEGKERSGGVSSGHVQEERRKKEMLQLRKDTLQVFLGKDPEKLRQSRRQRAAKKKEAEERSANQKISTKSVVLSESVGKRKEAREDAREPIEPEKEEEEIGLQDIEFSPHTQDVQKGKTDTAKKPMKERERPNPPASFSPPSVSGWRHHLRSSTHEKSKGSVQRQMPMMVTAGVLNPRYRGHFSPETAETLILAVGLLVVDVIAEVVGPVLVWVLIWWQRSGSPSGYLYPSFQSLTEEQWASFTVQVFVSVFVMVLFVCGCICVCDRILPVRPAHLIFRMLEDDFVFWTMVVGSFSLSLLQQCMQCPVPPANVFCSVASCPSPLITFPYFVFLTLLAAHVI
uniref:Uncharacterized protein n=1 Tax=Chromera velia CCMP2878 TaxID=1169474 RepID=A0A0G4GVG8_9ALVE|eukprot:Cvel_23530.t1-p1 / transcript=Cvel_23530.t1 / gene=Cvel_23530 / organism=Chromera_velia_CCMP2878 / gene_product=hypothetical protein / transcript_product=hypothetical protein / location=Cvel_scaffold2435:13560-21496(-) / protein_length=730 / sequence_SO=supercontig / SO=protein_coding / is_pseudo=false